MTGNDLSRLLRDGTPEPRRALSADDLLRRARRRRNARLGATGAAALVAVAGVALAVPGRLASAPAPLAASSPPAPDATGTPGSWPDPLAPNIDCAAYYPNRLGERANAFDGTVTAVAVGPRNDDAGGSPATVDLRVHRVFAGPPRETVRLTTWDFMLPRDPRSVVGQRVLVATGPELELGACGYTRPYSDHDAGEFYRAFAGAGSPRAACGIATDPRSDESRLVGMAGSDAVRDVESRGLTARVVTDDGPLTDDRPADRVTLCVRDDVVTAAARL